MPSIVRSPPVASSITSRSGPPSSGSSSSASSSRIATEPGRSFSSWCARSTVGSRIAEAARARREDGLEADRRGRDSRARARPPRPRAAPLTRRKSGPAMPSRCSSAYVSALSFERRIVSGEETSTGTGKRVAMRREAVEVERGLRQHRVHVLALDDVQHGIREARVRPRRHEVERVAQVPSDRALAHVGADEPNLALAVLAQPAQQRGAAGRARGGHEDGDRLHERSIRSAARRSRSSSRSASSIARIVSPIRAPGYTQISGCVSSCSHGKRAVAQLLVRAARAPVLVRVGAVGRRREPRRLHHVDGALDRRAHELRIRVVPRDDVVEPLVELRARVDGVEADPMAELPQPLERSLALVRGEVVEDRLGHQEVGRARPRLGLELGEPERRVQREVDVVAQDHVPVRRRALEEREPVAARLRGVEQLAVVVELEGTAHRRARIHWKVAPPSGSVIVTSSSRSSSNPASRSMRLFTSGGKLEK